MTELAKLIAFLLLFVTQALAENTDSLLAYQWSKRRVHHNDTLRTPTRMALSNKKSLLSCSIMCQTLGCIYIHFDSQTKVCQGYLGIPAMATYIWKRQCPDGYTYDQTMDICYKFHRSPLSWTVAKDTCASEGSILFVPYTERRCTFMLKFQEPINSASSTFWVGGTDIEEEGTWKWIDGADMENATKWSPGEPNNSGSIEHCLVIVVVYQNSYYHFNDDSCEKSFSFVCAH